MSKTTREWSIKDIRQEVDEMEKYILELEQKADEATGKIMSVECLGGAFGSMYHKVGDYGKSSYCSSVINPKSAVNNARARLETIWVEVNKKHEQNIPAIENNKKLFDKISLIMGNIGIPRTKRVQKGRKTVEESAGYLDDLLRFIRRDDGYAEAQRAYESYGKKIAQYETEQRQFEEAIKDAETKEVARKQKEREIVALCIKYDLPIESGWDDVISHIKSKDKYIALAHGLELNRGDWSNGYECAEYAIDAFKVETDIDKEIAKDIYECIREWDGDGRVFRDTTWNYNEVYKLADADLLSDFVKVKGCGGY